MSAAALPTEPAPATASSASQAASALAQAAERIRDAADRSQPLCIRGGGSKAFYGEPAQAGETLSTADLSGIVSYEPSELVVTARAGTPLSQLEALLAAQGQCLPFEPPHFGGGATVGGMVAAGLSGPARAGRLSRGAVMPAHTVGRPLGCVRGKEGGG